MSSLDKTITNNIKRNSEHITLNEDLNGYILWGSLCLNAQKNKYLYRVIFD